jgi:hypothetical protein
MATPPPPASVVVHPLVLLSVVDHYYRAARDTRKRVVGFLLGERTGTGAGVTVDITNSFAGEWGIGEQEGGAVSARRAMRGARGAAGGRRAMRHAIWIDGSRAVLGRGARRRARRHAACADPRPPRPSSPLRGG